MAADEAARTPPPPVAAPLTTTSRVWAELALAFPDDGLVPQDTADGTPTVWVSGDRLPAVARFLKTGVLDPYRTLFDVAAIDERHRRLRGGQPAADFTVAYHLTSYTRNSDVRLKVALRGEQPSVPTLTPLWPAASWYEREVWDMFGVGVSGHPDLRRILMPPWWEGHPLRKEHPSRGTEYGPFEMDAHQAEAWQEQLEFRPEEWGLPATGDDPRLMYLNVGPQHGATHGPLRIVVGLHDEDIVACAVDVGYHHRGSEKIAERQTWHTYIPYTDRIDYLAGVLNNLAYVSSVEKLAGIVVPERAEVIRVMLAEAFRLSSHLVFFGTFAQDIGALSPVFYTFEDRELLFDDVITPITGARMHPGWLRIGGVAEDLPQGWAPLAREFLRVLPRRLDQYERLVMRNSLVRARTRGVAPMSLDDAVEWGMTGPNLRACGLAWDLRKKRPYSGYERFEFEVPVGERGDCYDRVAVHLEEMRQSLRIIEQCVENMPAGPYKADHPLTMPPVKEPHTMHDIETLIDHFLSVSWGRPIPAGEAAVPIESAKGITAYYCVSDGGVSSYRTKIRSPSFAHLQAVPLLIEGWKIADLVTLLGSLDFVMGDVDR